MITEDTLSELRKISERVGHVATILNLFLALAIVGIVVGGCSMALNVLGALASV